MKTFTEGLTGGIFGLILAAVVASWQLVIVVSIIYAIALFGNLLTGLLYAKQTNTYSKEKGRDAFYKKAGMIVGIVSLFLLDFLIMGLARSGGISYNVPIFGCILAGYAAVHEFISMLQNLKKLGNKVPGALEGAAQKAEEALNNGTIPNINDLIKKDDKNED